MPIYEYRCESCSHELEKLQKISEPALRDCPACGQPSLKRLVSAAAFRLKGNGWYETDFKKGDKRNVTEAGGGSNSEPSATTADAKPGAASEAKKPDAKPAAASTSKT